MASAAPPRDRQERSAPTEAGAASFPDRGDGSTQGVILGDGRIAATAGSLLEALGFDPADDLRGLPFASFWSPSERSGVAAALIRARGGEEVHLDLDFDYIHHRRGMCTISLMPAGAAGLVMMTVLL